MSMKAILKEIEEEFERANAKFPPFNSNHEGYGVLAEEVAELFDEIRASKAISGNRMMRQEAVQVAAMAVKLAISTSEAGVRWRAIRVAAKTVKFILDLCEVK